MAGSLLQGRIRSGSPYNALLGEFLGRPYRDGAAGPDAYDCYGLCRAFMARLGVELPDLGQTSVAQASELRVQADPHFIRLTWPRPWSLISLRRNMELATHCGIVLPTDGLFLHAQEKSGVVCEPIAHRYWHPRIEGYYWPRGVVEMVVMHSPIGLDHSWAFFREGLSVAEMLGVTQAESAQLRVFLDGKEVERGAWAQTRPTALQQLVVRPQYGEGRDVLRMVGMLALSIISYGFLSTPVAAGGAGLTGINLGVAMAGVTVAGGYLMGALIPPKKLDNRMETSYGWNAQTVQREGPIPRVYGRIKVTGNVIMAYGLPDNAVQEYPESLAWFRALRGLGASKITDSGHLWHCKIGIGDGPLQGPVAGTRRINGRPENEYPGLSVEYRRGSDVQTATAMGDRVQYDPAWKLEYNTPQTYSFPDQDIDKLAVIVSCPRGLLMIDSSGDRVDRAVGVKIEIRPANGSWQTLADTLVSARSTKWIREIFYSDQTYEGGAPVTITRGTAYEVRVTRTTAAGSSTNVVDELYLESVQGIYNDGFRYPGLAYVAVSALASDKLSGTLEYEEVWEGRIVQVWTGSAWVLQYSNNPAWVLVDVLTRPVIHGNGDPVPYSVEYFRGIDIAWIDAPAFKALADWCDEQVSNGRGGYEKRFEFNGILDDPDEAWQYALRVAAMCRAWPYFNGRQVTVAIDKAATPVQAFTVGNILKGAFTETWIGEEDRISEIDYTILDAQQDYRRTPVRIIDQEVTRRAPLAADGWGITSQSQLWRTGIHLLTLNRLMPRSVEFSADLDAIYCRIGDVIYVQHNNMSVNQGGRVTAVNGNTITVDFTPAYTPDADSVLVRTCDLTDGEKLTLYPVTAVNGNTITVSGWTYAPQPNDVVMYGQTTAINDLYRIRWMERTQDGQVRLFATAYDEDYYGPDSLTPIIAVQQAATTAQTDPGLWRRPLSRGDVDALAPQTAIVDSSTDLHPRLSALSFWGNSVDKVFWTGSGDNNYGVILYQGFAYPIAPNTAGTTNKYVYFDPNVTNPSVLQSTNDLDSLKGQERFLACINIDGTIYPQNLQRLGIGDTSLDWSLVTGVGRPADYADVTADNPVSTLRENFEDPHNDVADRWIQYNAAACSIVAQAGEAGGKVLRCGDNAGNDEVNLLYFRKIPFDPSKLYRLRVRVRTTAGSGKFYLGIYGYDAAGNVLNPDGYTAHWIGAYDRAVPSTWTVYTGYFLGHSASGTGTEAWSPAAPGTLRAGVAYFSVFAHVNYNTAGITDIDEISVDIMPETGDFLNFAGTTAPAVRLGATWLNTNWCGQDVVAHWRLNENAASPFVKDESPCANHGAAARNTSLLTTAGKVGTALSFNGSTDKITVPNAPSLNFGTGDFSIAAWIKSSSQTTQRIVSKWSGSQGYDFHIYVAGGVQYLYCFIGDGSGNTGVNTVVTVLDGNWHFVGVTVDRDGNSYFYVDGVLSSAKNLTNRPGSIDTANSLFLGVYGDGSSAPWNGALDNIMLFRRALTKADFDALYDAGTGTEQIGLGSRRILLRSDGTYWLLADSDSPTIPRSAAEIAETTDRKWAAESGADVTGSHTAAAIVGQGALATKSTVGTSDIEAGAVTVDKIGSAAVTEIKLAANAVTSEKIAVNAVIAGKVAANAIGADQIAAGAVIADKIAANAITTGKIAAGAITSSQIAAGTILAGNIHAEAIETAAIKVGNVTTDRLANQAVTQIVSVGDYTGYGLFASPYSGAGYGKWCVTAVTPPLTSGGYPCWVFGEGLSTISLAAAVGSESAIFCRDDDEPPNVFIGAVTFSGTNPVQITTTVAHGLSNDQYVWITSVVGTVELNYGIFRVTVVDGTRFALQGTRSDWFSPYTGGGRVRLVHLHAIRFNTQPAGANLDSQYFCAVLDELLVSAHNYRFLLAFRNLSPSVNGYCEEATVLALEVKR